MIAMIAKCERDETTKLVQYRRNQSRESLGDYRLRIKRTGNPRLR